MMDGGNGRSIARYNYRGGCHSGDGYYRENSSFNLQRLGLGNACTIPCLGKLVGNDHLGCALLSDSLCMLLLLMLLLLLLLLMLLNHRLGGSNIDHRNTGLMRLPLLLENKLLQDVTRLGTGSCLNHLPGLSLIRSGNHLISL